MSGLENELRRHFGRRLEVARPLAELTSFKIGGPADLFLLVEDEDDLCHAIALAARFSAVTFCLGAGTNLLVSERGMRGLVIKLGEKFNAVTINGTSVTAGAAAQFRELVASVVERGLAGLEFGEGIPGTVGGGLVMNAGAFGGEMARVVRLVHGIRENGERAALTRDEVGFAYRRTSLPPRFIITRVDFELSHGDHATLRARVAELHDKRASRQPRELPNAGSIFKNPPGHFAGRLLETAGLKGLRVGGAAFSCRHANFIVNLGGARAEEVRELIEIARAKVREATGVSLETEVKMVGDW
jgi:UDP-N-acetylmuramate dehydrogenase